MKLKDFTASVPHSVQRIIPIATVDVGKDEKYRRITFERMFVLRWEGKRETEAWMVSVGDAPNNIWIREAYTTHEEAYERFMEFLSEQIQVP